MWMLALVLCGLQEPSWKLAGQDSKDRWEQLSDGGFLYARVTDWNVWQLVSAALRLL